MAVQELLTAEPPHEPVSVHGFVKGRISVIMPAYNKAEVIGKAINDVRGQFEEVSGDFEIIVVDDGSTDRTRDVAKSMSNGRIRVLGYDSNQGKGSALRRGFLAATGEFTFLMDSDSEIKARELKSYVEGLRSADIVIGSKRHSGSRVQTPILRRFLSLGFNVLERLLTGVRATDTQAGLKALKGEVLYLILPLLSVKKYAFDVELLAVASLLNCKIRELPVRIQLKATFSARHVLRMLIDLLGIAYRLRVKRWYQKNLSKMTETYKPIIPW